MCDEGRFGWKYIHALERLKYPEIRSAGKVTSTEWELVLPAVRAALEGAATHRPETLTAVLSPWMTCEEGYLLAKYLKGLSPRVKLAMGPVRVDGEDDRYPKDVHGRPAEPTTFTIRAEKCPNRRGIEIVLRHFQKDAIGFDRVLADVQSGATDAMFLVGGDPRPWISEEQARLLEKLKLLIVEDILPTAASTRAPVCARRRIVRRT
jgi:NADH-quinone oxidoreductase subunit G